MNELFKDLQVDSQIFNLDELGGRTLAQPLLRSSHSPDYLCVP